MKNMRYEIFCDGSSLRGAGGGAGYYVELEGLGSMMPHKRTSIALEKNATNNQAEYEAVIGALRYLTECVDSHGVAIIKSDSQLVIRQINGEYTVKDKKMKILHSVALDLVELLQSRNWNLVFEHLPRELNTTADALSRIGALLSNAKEV